MSFGEKEVTRLDLKTYLALMSGKGTASQEDANDDVPPDVDESERPGAERLAAEIRKVLARLKRGLPRASRGDDDDIW